MTNTFSDVTHEQVAQAAEGDARAVESIVRALERPIYNVALRMLLDRQDAEDATQESLIRIMTRLAQFRGESRFSTWAWSIAVRRILDFRQRRAHTSFEAFAEDLAEGRDEHAVERTEDAILHQQLKLRCGRALLQCLDADHRIAFVLGELLELPSNDAAEILDIEPAAFRKRLSRARTALSDFLNKQCGVVNPSAPCACHRRLGRALEKGRVEPAELPDESLPALRARLSTLSELRRVTAFYRSEPASTNRTDFVATLRSMLGSLH
ncbi:RNA polymerase sigma-E factor [Myxococcus stipitatus DSM 14675]|uniref:RNA polymerase sigma-E factor n=1 Tax=Myxococcus stipitatus (strain DSM 14675 / JCM 12634 / Mx s8) TaxID=1278073 RepID=L7UJS4_MYXSD|nr:RNA polymerase sigma factor [Myxococcus stipitatus]AGC46699.1 RNA polymerase sigma-E factor [Myxococcus stipitatus DSM 14675]